MDEGELDEMTDDDSTEKDSEGESDGSDVEDAKATNDDSRYAKIRSELANMSFEELLLLKERLGTKAYNAAMFPTKVKKDQKTTFRRENKNRPQEVSSKIRSSQLRSVIPIKKKVARDPRFDDLSGSFNETYFKQAYGLMSDVKQREKQKLLKSLKVEKSPAKRKKIEDLLKSMTQKEKQEQVKEQQTKREKDRKKKERELVAKGKKPFYLKKSEKKRLEKEEKEETLKKAGQMDKYLKKQSKKQLARDRKNLSFL